MCHLGGGLFVAQVGVWMHRFAATKSEELQHGCAHHSSRALQGVKRHCSSSHAVVLRMLKVVQVDRAKERQLEHNDGLCCGSIGRRWQCLIATSDGEETKQLQRSPSVLWLQNYVAMLCVHLHGTVQTSVVEKFMIMEPLVETLASRILLFSTKGTNRSGRVRANTSIRINQSKKRPGA